MKSLLNIVRGVALLRYPEMLRILGEERLRYLAWRSVLNANPLSKIARTVEFPGYDPDRVTLGAGTTVCQGSILASGDEVNGFGRIMVGQGTWIGQYNNLRASRDADIKIGRDCLISQFCTLVGSNHRISRGERIKVQGQDPSRLGVTLGDDVWLGAGVAVMPGVAVGNGAVVGANAVVTSDIGADEIWAGVPARKIGDRE